MFRDRDIETPSDRKGKGSVVAGGQLTDGSGEVAVEAVHASEECLAEGLVVGAVGDAQTNASHTVEEAEPSIEARNVTGGAAPGLDNGRPRPVS